MTEFQFVAKIKFKAGSENANICSSDPDFESIITDKMSEFDLDGDKHYLGYIPSVFYDQDTTKKLLEECYRSFHDGICSEKDGMTIFFRSSHDASREFFRAWFDADKTVKSISISIDTDDELAVKELGRNFKIKINSRTESN